LIGHDGTCLDTEKSNLAREGSGLVRIPKKKERKVEGTHPLEWDCPGHAKKGASEVESATGQHTGKVTQ